MYRSPGHVDQKSRKRSQARRLQEIVERLETGDLPLEESLAAFERGIALTRSCQTALKEAEQKVQILLKKAGEPVLDDFDNDESQTG